MGRWRVATVYGGKEAVHRRLLWEKLDEFGSNSHPLVVGGDFNCIFAKEDKRGGRPFRFSQGAREMSSFVERSNLHEVSVSGPRFTWCNNKDGNVKILERLDRCYVNPLALKNNRLVLRHLSRVASDHCPILLNFLEGNVFSDKIIRKGSLNGWPFSNNSIDEKDREWLTKVLSLEDLEMVMLQTTDSIAPRNDGVSYSFMKSYWNIIKKYCWYAANQFFRLGKMNVEWKETILVLIPKVLEPAIPNHYRPIRLCRSIYKVMARILLNIMKLMIHKLVFMEQAAFINGRSLGDHILVAQEAFSKVQEF
ncbi:uncharacterized protein LOC110108401 [Dendrobium catenatum]|uniref:uncharacterized protein LOC110108401 n=1 Tax=Dendrobium catenatum TaxID=906689 RepID=UPI0009F20BFA|nr:uncharacterized protein LOC110108401 [Dendrobium catenatum]